MFNLTLVVAGLKEFIIDRLGGSVSDATLFFSVETFAYILFAPLWGLVSDRLGRRKVFIVLGFAASGVFYASYSAVSSIPVLLGLRFLQGACSVMGWSLVMALLLGHPDQGRKGRQVGLMGASLIFGVALGAPVGGYLSRWFGPEAPFETAAALFALLAIGSFLLHESKGLRRQVRLHEIGTALRARPRLLLPMTFHFVDRLAVGLFVVVFPLYLVSLGASDPAVRGRYLAFFLLPFAFLQFFTGKMAERTGPYPPLIYGSLSYGVVLMFVGYSDLVLLAPVMIALGVLASVMFPPAMLLTAQLADPLTRGSAIGGFNLAGSLGFGLGPLLGGWAYASRGFAFAFVLCGLLEVLLAIATAILIRHWNRESVP